MANFQLNFSDDKKRVSVTLKESDAIFELAQAFSKFLTDNGIENVLEEHIIPQVTKTDKDVN
jgi:hypothetical protein